jgi:hypothetical protein
MLIKIDKLESVIDNLVLYSSFNIVIIAKEERFIQRVLNYLLRVSPYRFEVVNINHPDKLLYLYRNRERFIGVIIADSPEEFEKLIERYLIESLTTYNYDYNKVDLEKVKASLPDVIHRLNARYLYIDQIADKEIEDKENQEK